MTTADTTRTDVHGPVDAVVIEFPPGADTSAATAALADLVESGTIRLYDLLVVRKEEDGSVTELDLSAETISLSVFSGARSGLLGDDDATETAELLEPGRMAAVIVYENAWAIPFVAAARDAGGELIAKLQMTAQDIMDTLDRLEGTS